MLFVSVGIPVLEKMLSCWVIRELRESHGLLFVQCYVTAGFENENEV